MKRRFLLVLILILSISVGVVVINGCSEGKVLVTESDTQLLAGFEDYDELTSYHWLNYFGSARLDGKTYVTEGKSGVALEVNGVFGESRSPILAIDTQTEYIEKKDFSDVTAILLDVYSKNSAETNVYFQYVSTTDTGTKLSGLMKQTIVPGSKSTVRFDIDRNLASKFLNLKMITQLRIVFDGPADANRNYRKFNVDNLRCVTTEEPIIPELIRGDDEIESADKEEYQAAWYLPLTYQWSPSSMQYNTDPQFKKGGDGSFKIVSEGTVLTGKPKTSSVWAMSSSELKDISSYYSISFWVYNANPETDPSVDASKAIGFYLRNEKIKKEFFLKNLSAGWNYFEITTDDLKNLYEFDLKDFLFGMLFYAPTDKNYVYYFDELYANSMSSTPTLDVAQSVSGFVPGKITLPKPSVKYANGYTLEIRDPDGKSVAVSGDSFAAAKTGTYTATYSVTGTRPDHTGSHITVIQKMTVYVGKVPQFTTKPADEYRTDFGSNYSVTSPAASADGTVTWRVELFSGACVGGNGVAPGLPYSNMNNNGYTGGVITGSPTFFKLIKNADHRIVYSVTNTDGNTSEYVQHIFAQDALYGLGQKYGDFYSAAALGGDLSRLENGFRLSSSGNSAVGTLTNKVFVGYQNDKVRFMLRNNGRHAVTFKVNNGMLFTLPAGTQALFDPDVFGYDTGVVGWKIVTADRKLGELKFTSTGASAGIDVEIYRFGVNTNSFNDPILTAGAYEKFYSIDTVLALVKPGLVGLTDYSFTVVNPMGDVVRMGTNKEIEGLTVKLDIEGEWKIHYKIVYQVDGADKEAIETAVFRVIPDVIDWIAQKNEIVDWTGKTGQTYTLKSSDKPDLSLAVGENPTVTWYIESFVNNNTENKDFVVVRVGAENAETFTPAYNTSYRIVYSVSAYGETFVCSKTLYFADNAGLKELSDKYSDFYSAGGFPAISATTPINKLTKGSDGASLVLSGEKDTDGNVTGAYRNRVEMGDFQKFSFVVYNAGDEDVLLFFRGAPVTSSTFFLPVKARHYATFSTTAAGAGSDSWQFVGADKKFGGAKFSYMLDGGLWMRVYSPSQKVNLVLSGIKVDDKAFDIAVGDISYGDLKVGDRLQIVEPILKNADGYTFEVFDPKGISVFSGDKDTADKSFVTELVGRYEIVYTVTDSKTSSSKEFQFNCNVKAASYDWIAQKNAIVDWSGKAGQKYTLTAADKPDLTLAVGATATWKIDFMKKNNNADFNSTVLAGDNLQFFVPTANYSYRIQYTVAVGDETYSCYRTLLFHDLTGKMAITDKYADFYTAGTTGLSMKKGSDGLVLSGTAAAEVTGTYANGVSMGTNFTNFLITFYNDSDEDVFVYFGGAPAGAANKMAVKSHHYMVWDTTAATAKAWTFVKEDGTFGASNGAAHFRVRNATKPVNLRIFGIYVNKGAFPA